MARHMCVGSLCCVTVSPPGTCKVNASWLALVAQRSRRAGPVPTVFVRFLAAPAWQPGHGRVRLDVLQRGNPLAHRASLLLGCLRCLQQSSVLQVLQQVCG